MPSSLPKTQRGVKSEDSLLVINSGSGLAVASNLESMYQTLGEGLKR